MSLTHFQALWLRASLISKHCGYEPHSFLSTVATSLTHFQALWLRASLISKHCDYEPHSFPSTVTTSLTHFQALWLRASLISKHCDYEPHSFLSSNLDCLYITGRFYAWTQAIVILRSTRYIAIGLIVLIAFELSPTKFNRIDVPTRYCLRLHFLESMNSLLLVCKPLGREMRVNFNFIILYEVSLTFLLLLLRRY